MTKQNDRCPLCESPYVVLTTGSSSAKCSSCGYVGTLNSFGISLASKAPPDKLKISREQIFLIIFWLVFAGTCSYIGSLFL